MLRVKAILRVHVLSAWNNLRLDQTEKSRGAIQAFRVKEMAGAYLSESVLPRLQLSPCLSVWENCWMTQLLS